jgi:hypothetical protein
MPRAKTQLKKKVAKKPVKKTGTIKKTVKKAIKPKKAVKKVVAKKRVVKKTIAKKKIVKKPVVKKAVKKSVVKSNLPKNEGKKSSSSFAVGKRENKRLFSPDVFGTPQIGSPYFNTIRRQIEVQRLVQGQNINNTSEEFGSIKNSFIESFEETKSSGELKKEKVIFVKKENDISIDFDLKVFDGSPHVVDLQSKNTHEIKELISGKQEKRNLPLQYLPVKAKAKKIKPIKKVKLKTELMVKPNLINEDLIWEKRKNDEKIGFWKTLIMPIYTIFHWAENLFIDLSSLTRGKFPRVFRFSLPDKWHKSLATFVILCLMFVLPFESVFIYSATDKKGIVLGEATTAIDSLKMGGESVLDNNLVKANYYFLESLGNFEKANQELTDINSFIIKLLEKTQLDGGRVSSGKNLVSFGESVSRSAVYLNTALVSLIYSDENSEMSSIKVNDTVIEGVNLPGDILTKISSVKGNVFLAAQELRLANNNLKNVNLDVLEDGDREKILRIKEVLPVLISSLDNFHELLGSWELILGKDQFKRYLLVFQNNYELRATGGFIGSYALMDIDEGVIEGVEMPGGGSYDLQGGLNKRISAPEPFYLISPLWQFHDANWWPDFPTSARKLMHFYEISGGRTVDGVIAMTPQMIIDLLKITGPIEMEEYDEVVTADNFMWVTQYNVELEYDKEENKPKKFLSDLCIKLLSRITDKDILADQGGVLGFVNILSRAARKKDLQLYFDDSSVQNVIEKYSLDGGIKNTDGDYLMVINTNVGGGKSDSVIQQTIDLESKVGRDGSIFNKLTIKRKHNGNPDDFFQRVRNVNWLRVYVPEEAELIAVRGFEKPGGEFFRKPDGELEIDKDINELDGGYMIDEDSGTRIYDQFGKTVFANWSMIDLGEEALIEIEYKLPFGLFKKEVVEIEEGLIDKIVSSFIQEEDIPFRDLRSHTLLVQKQSGIDSNFNYKLVVPFNWDTVWVKSPSDNTPDRLTYDKFFGKIFEIKYPTLPNL